MRGSRLRVRMLTVTALGLTALAVLLDVDYRWPGPVLLGLAAGAAVDAALYIREMAAAHRALHAELADAYQAWNEAELHDDLTCSAVIERDRAHAAIERVRQLRQIAPPEAQGPTWYALDTALDTLDQPKEPTL